MYTGLNKTVSVLRVFVFFRVSMPAETVLLHRRRLERGQRSRLQTPHDIQ